MRIHGSVAAAFLPSGALIRSAAAAEPPVRAGDGRGRQLFANLQLQFHYLLVIHIGLVLTATLTACSPPRFRWRCSGAQERRTNLSPPQFLRPESLVGPG